MEHSKEYSQAFREVVEAMDGVREELRRMRNGVVDDACVAAVERALHARERLRRQVHTRQVFEASSPH
ncbi:hypothetical protein SAMN04488595_1322 [Ralstonia sp. 25mfcol4.1]|uniref:hypothetical protein n=1 Tax=Ralstonia sp. 25mfcol4.1 TaxID=1761899 RepID=UPI00042A8249|nr:hypothetical protein [Ralstonia sp. 25mfcol4.1]SDP82484.1 hypothetical protein SAMN04488595_1322 [Ralstonia sp. 25mfcol4.1]